MLALLKTYGLRATLVASLFAVMAASTPAPAAANGSYNNGVRILNAGPSRTMPNNVNCGVQFTYTLSPNQTALFYTYGWNSSDKIDWMVMNDTINGSGPVVTLSNVATQRTSSTAVTYWLTVQNYTSSNQDIEGRFCILHH